MTNKSNQKYNNVLELKSAALAPNQTALYYDIHRLINENLDLANFTYIDIIGCLESIKMDVYTSHHE